MNRSCPVKINRSMARVEKSAPDLTGGGRDNLDYLLENIVDPSAVVTADYRMSILEAYLMHRTQVPLPASGHATGAAGN